MKKSIKIWLIAAMVAVSGSAWGTNSMPGGTYYFDFSACTGDNAAYRVEVFNGIADNTNYVALVSSATCAANTGVTQSSETKKQFYNGGNAFKVFCVTLDNNRSTDQSGFIQYQPANDGKWKGWANYTTPTPVSGETNVYLCKVSYSEGNCTYTWHTGTLPSNICTNTPVLTFTAGSNGGISTHTAGGSNISTGAEVAAGTSVNLVATPDTGYSFYGWVRSDGSVASTLANYVFSMPSSSLDLTATFYSDSTDPVISGDGCSGCFRVAP